MSITFDMPHEVAHKIALKSRNKRLALELTQKTLAERAGVSYGTLKKFERTGIISLVSLCKIALVLDALSDFASLFEAQPIPKYTSIEQIINQKKRQRGRK